MNRRGTLEPLDSTCFIQHIARMVTVTYLNLDEVDSCETMFVVVVSLKTLAFRGDLVPRDFQIR